MPERIETFKQLPPGRMKFLRAFSRCGLVREAAAASKTSRTQHAKWMARSAVYRKLFRRAQVRSAHLKEQVLEQLAVIGVPKFHEGRPLFEYFDAAGEPCDPEEVVYVDAAGKPCDENARGAVKKLRWVRRERVRQINVAALIVALKAAFPDRYRERREVKHTGIPRPDPVNEQVRKILADPNATELANALARRMACHAGGNGQSAN